MIGNKSEKKKALARAIIGLHLNQHELFVKSKLDFVALASVGIYWFSPSTLNLATFSNSSVIFVSAANCLMIGLALSHRFREGDNKLRDPNLLIPFPRLLVTRSIILGILYWESTAFCWLLEQNRLNTCLNSSMATVETTAKLLTSTAVWYVVQFNGSAFIWSCWTWDWKAFASWLISPRNGYVCACSLHI